MKLLSTSLLLFGSIALADQKAALEQLPPLDEALCAAVYEAVKTTANVGLRAIYGDPVDKEGFEVGIKAVKTINKYGGAQDLFKVWYDGSCASGEIDEDISKIWDEWASLSDEDIPSSQLSKRAKKPPKTQAQPPKTDPPKTQAPPPKTDPPKTEPPKTEPPKATTTNAPKTSSKVESSKADSTSKASTSKASTSKVDSTSKASSSQTGTPSPSGTSATSSTTPSSSLSSSSGTASPTPSGNSCYRYTALADKGPDNDLGIEKRDNLAGRIDLVRRAAKDPRLELGSCKYPDGFQMKWNDAAPAVSNVVNNKNFKGKKNYNEALDKIPRWYDMEQNCNSAPGYKKIDESAATENDIVNGKENNMKKWNVDHIWEKNMLKLFIKDTLAGKASCDDFTKAFFKDGKNDDEQPLTKLFALIPRNLEPNQGDQAEFMGLRTAINGKKARLFNPTRGLGDPDFKKNQMKDVKTSLDIIRQVGIAQDLCHISEVKSLWERAQKRMTAYLEELDKDSGATFKWADAFTAWMRDFLNKREQDNWKFIQDAVKDIEADIKKMDEKKPEDKQKKDDYQSYLDVFKKSEYNKKSHYDFKFSV